VRPPAPWFLVDFGVLYRQKALQTADPCDQTPVGGRLEEIRPRHCVSWWTSEFCTAKKRDKPQIRVTRQHARAARENEQAALAAGD